MKRIILLVTLLILSGCHANVDFSIEKSGKLTEHIKIMDAKVNHGEISNYDSYISELIADNISLSKIRDYNKNNIIDSENLGIDLSKNHEMLICSNFRNSSLEEIMNDFKCVEENNVYTISGIPTYFVCGSDCFYPPEIKSATINISLPNKAISSNANFENDNTYTWNFSGNEDESFELKFSLIDDEQQTILDNEKAINKKDITLIILFSLALIISLVLITINLSKKYKENNLKY